MRRCLGWQYCRQNVRKEGGLGNNRNIYKMRNEERRRREKKTKPAGGRQIVN